MGSDMGSNLTSPQIRPNCPKSVQFRPHTRTRLAHYEVTPADEGFVPMVLPEVPQNRY